MKCLIIFSVVIAIAVAAPGGYGADFNGRKMETTDKTMDEELIKRPKEKAVMEEVHLSFQEQYLEMNHGIKKSLKGTGSNKHGARDEKDGSSDLANIFTISAW